jgi:hypothetical protein
MLLLHLSPVHEVAEQIFVALGCRRKGLQDCMPELPAAATAVLLAGHTR